MSLKKKIRKNVNLQFLREVEEPKVALEVGLSASDHKVRYYLVMQIRGNGCWGSACWIWTKWIFIVIQKDSIVLAQTKIIGRTMLCTCSVGWTTKPGWFWVRKSNFQVLREHWLFNMCVMHIVRGWVFFLVLWVGKQVILVMNATVVVQTLHMSINQIILVELINHYLLLMLIFICLLVNWVTVIVVV